ncbi:DEHA2D10626p [Debaryomyces hansenii CBS767]|uniref:DEHA2D10626p n=1 Tax=Debaryomyces hansenii (strain ATCC 36239 / CBS 767 / BCRC 21394 / JCM 1990 / NBRC 0083 / IGC 2968) TaxID=284592 RepID=Q6BS93_DEBHA|nr:DEHA2D10626p [Debaryomyces hansenii CBS767]CAG87083.2 DEHA2D10626p [Debaryomyces hansenii CBS767]|eukprot:XP_458927.2 DEHA2D10626p [Debaryomyces hansenii CBS767]
MESPAINSLSKTSEGIHKDTDYSEDMSRRQERLENSSPQPYAKDEEEQFYSDSEGEIRDFRDQDNRSINSTHGSTHSKHSTVLEKVQSQYSFFHEKLGKQRKGIVIKYALIYLLMSSLILGMFSIYWGSFYQRNSRLKNLNMLVVIEDDHTVDGIEPVIGNTIREILNTDAAKAYGKWHIFNQSEIREQADKNKNDVDAEVQRLIHHQQYWSSIYVKPEASYNLYKAISEGDASYNVTDNTILSYYETGRDFLSMNSYVTPSIKIIEQMWLKKSANVTLSLTNKLSSSERSDVLSDSNSLELLSTPISFTYIDKIPFTDPVLTAPSQVGLIYMIIITFFQVNFFMDVHKGVASLNIKPMHFVVYRILSSVLSFFVISLFFSFPSLAFQVDFTKAFGNSGFLIYWMITFLTMWAVGMANEVMALICVMVYPPLMGFWMLFWVIINIAPTFAPIALCPEFYRYGYGLPIHNSYEITKVILFDTYKGNLGRSFGIVIAWVVIFTLLLPFVLKLFSKTMAKRAQAAAQAAQKSANN